MRTSQLSIFQKHCERWKNGCGSRLCFGVKNVCLARGKVPCDVLFVGEAPGESEDTIGKPFVGPAGKLLDYIIGRALQGTELRAAFTNLVCCIPRDDDGGKSIEPDDDSVDPAPSSHVLR